MHPTFCCTRQSNGPIPSSLHTHNETQRDMKREGKFENISLHPASGESTVLYEHIVRHREMQRLLYTFLFLSGLVTSSKEEEEKEVRHGKPMKAPGQLVRSSTVTT